MHRFAKAMAALAPTLAPLAACAPAPGSKTPQAPAPRPVAAAPPPARHATMICRNSQNGRKVECGTPDAVMVGVKED